MLYCHARVICRKKFRQAQLHFYQQSSSNSCFACFMLTDLVSIVGPPQPLLDEASVEQHYIYYNAVFWSDRGMRRPAAS